MLNVALRVIRDRKRSILFYGIGLGLLLLMYVGIFPLVLDQADALEDVMKLYPESLKDAFGMDEFRFDTIERFLSLEYYAFIWPITMMTLAFGLAGSAIAGEIERGTVEHLLAKPISRADAFFGKYLGGAAVMLVFTLSSVFLVIPEAIAVGIDYNLRAHVAVAIMGFLFAMAVYSVAMLVSAASSEKGKVSLFAGSIVIGMYVANIVSGLVDGAAWLKYTSLFHYFNYQKALVDGAVDGTGVVVLLDVILLCAAFGMYVFERRDVAA